MNIIGFGRGKIVTLECNATAKFHKIKPQNLTLSGAITYCGIHNTWKGFANSGYGWNAILESFPHTIDCKNCIKSYNAQMKKKTIRKIKCFVCKRKFRHTHVCIVDSSGYFRGNNNKLYKLLDDNDGTVEFVRNIR